MLEAMLSGTAYAIDSFTSGERPGLTIATCGVPRPILCEAELQQVQDGAVFAFDLNHGAGLGSFVRAPSKKLRIMTKAAFREMVELHFHRLVSPSRIDSSCRSK